MKILLLFPLLVLFSCGPAPVANQPAPSQPAAPVNPAATASVQFHKHPKDGGGYQLYARINGTDHLIQDNIERFDPSPKSEFVENGVPANAITAGTFLNMLDSEEDTQGVYAVSEGAGVGVYRGYYVPGDWANIRWKRVSLD